MNKGFIKILLKQWERFFFHNKWSISL